jgi:hypothetical protein
MMGRSYPRIAVIIISGLYMLLNSCLEVACIDETEAYVKASFFSYSSGEQAVPDSITLYGINKEENKIYDKFRITPPALIPLSDSTDYSTFVIRINGINDTIEFRYWSYPHLVTKECGYTFYHHLDTLYHTKHAIDSVSKINENITTVNEENIRIYY